MTTLHDVALLRLAAQRIAGPGLPTVLEAVRWMTAVQAQDLPGVLTSVALRTERGTRAAVAAALDAGSVVRSWPMRGTLHLVAAEDLPWMLPVTAPRAVVGATARRAQLGLDAGTLERARELAEAALSGGGRLSRDELFAVWRAGGVGTDGQRGYHVLAHLAQTGLLCLGPLRGREQLVVLVDGWIPGPRRLARDEALGELALRYFRSHGPATVKDLARWGKLVATDVRVGAALARPHLDALVVNGVEYLLDPATPDLLAAVREAARGVFLLPGFDELLLGYGDRSAVLPAEYADRVVPGRNGFFRPTVVTNGRVIGTWQNVGSGPRPTLSAIPFEDVSPAVDEAITRAYAALPA